MSSRFNFRWWVFFLLAASARLAPADCVPTTGGLIGWWPADGNANDVFGTNNGVLQGGATANAPGMVGMAFSFDGTNGSVQVPNSPLLRPTNLTIETWVRFTALDSAGSGGSPAGDQYLVFRQNTRSSDFEGFDLSKTRIGGSDVFRFLLASASGQTVLIRSATTISTGAWYHVAAVRGSNFVQLYVNGVLEQQTNITFAQDYGNFPIYFGTSGQPSWDHKLKGNLDEATLYDRPLSSSEIMAIYAAGAAGKCKAPNITSQPQSSSVPVGTNVTFSVQATGFGTLGYEWRSNGLPIVGANAASLTLSNVQPAASGDYTVVVTNSFAAVTSAVAVLHVAIPPQITHGPASQTNLSGTTAQFTVTVSGDQPLNFQWFFNGNLLTDDLRHSGSTTTNLTITGIVDSDGGNYTVVASNSFGVRTSAVATLTVLVPATIVSQPGFQAPFPNEPASFTVGVKGTEPVTFQWYGNGSPLSDGGRFSGCTTSNLTIQNVQFDDQGNYQVVVSNAWGASTSSVATLSFAVKRYVDPASSSPLMGYLGWSTAARTIQDAINACNPGDWIIVTNGIYQTGGAVVKTNNGNKALSRVAVTMPLTIRSVNGPAFTTILANVPPYPTYGARCVYLTNGASISGFTLSAGYLAFGTPGFDDWDGGGVLCEDTSAVVSNCIIKGNTAPYGAGAFRGTLVNCLITGNNATGQGGGAYVSTVVNCTVTANHADYGGGMGHCSVTNSIVYGNSVNSPWTNTNHFLSSFYYSCTAPDPGGVGNITNAPVFINEAAGNYRQQSNSPCVNAGLNVFPPGSVDLDGAPRVVDGVIDMGAYEFQHAPFILTPPTNQTVVMFSNVLFAASALGEEPLLYIWQKDGTNVADDARLSGAAAPSLSISNVLAQDGGNYRIIISNVFGSVTSAVATLTIQGPPVIFIQPVSRTVPAGTNVSFSVSASGLATLSYQWRFAQTNLAGRTTTALSLTNVQVANAGDYDVVITNIYGALTSSFATLTVLPAAPIITTQAVSRVASVGSTVSFAVAAKGTEPMTCQWQRDGNDLPGATGFTLTFQNVNSSFNGTYRAAVSNAAGFAFSTNVTLVASPVLMWGRTNNPQLQLIALIPPTATNVVAIAAGATEGNGVPCMALRADGSFVTWGYGSRDPLPPTNAVDLVAVSLGVASSTTIANNLVLRADGTVVNWGNTKPPLPAALTNGNIVAVAAGALHQMALRDDGSVFAWGDNSSGQTNVPPSATNVIAIAAGQNHSLALRVDGLVIGWGLNGNGQATAFSNAANVVMISAGGNQSIGLRADGSVAGRLQITQNPNISYGPPPADATNMIAIAAGSAHSLALRADGTITGWGHTNLNQLIIPSYATNVLAIAAGGEDSLALVPDPFAPPILPRIGRPPLSRVLQAGQSAVMNALAIGGLPLRYQWYRDAILLTGKTNQYLWFTNCQPGEAGNYQFAAINDFGSVTSAVAIVSVTLPRPALKPLGRNGNGFHFTLNTFNGVLYITEFQTGVSSGVWSELERRIGAGVTETFTDPNATTQARFYRVRAIYPPP